MKIAITSEGSTLDDRMDQRFGRAAKFIIFETDDESFAVVDNDQNLNAAQGAGIQAAKHVVDSGARALVTGHTGPKAFTVLNAAGIAVYLAPVGTVREAIVAWVAGSLNRIDRADVEGHWV